VQEWEQKDLRDCVAGQIAPGPKLVGVVDLSKVIDKSTATLIKKSRDPIGIWIDVDQVNNDGSIVMRVTGVSRGEEHLWEPVFSLSEKLRVRQISGGLRVEMLNVRRLPKENEPELFNGHAAGCVAGSGLFFLSPPRDLPIPAPVALWA